MGNAPTVGNAGAAIYFILLMLFGKYTLMQMLTALMISKLPDRNYLTQVDDATRTVARMRDVALKEIEAGTSSMTRSMSQLSTVLTSHAVGGGGKESAPGPSQASKTLTTIASLEGSLEGGLSQAASSASDVSSTKDVHKQSSRRRALSCCGVLGRALGHSLHTIGSCPPLRWLQQRSHAVIKWRWRRLPMLISFESFIMWMILLSVVVLTMQTFRELPETTRDVLSYLDFGTACIFLVELFLRFTALGPRKWVRDGWNWLDAVLVLTAAFSMMGTIQHGFGDESGGGSTMGSASKGLRGLRVLRPLRSVRRLPRLKLAVTTVLQVLPATGGVICLALFIWYLVAIVAVAQLGGLLIECTSTSFACTTSPELCANNSTLCALEGGSIRPQPYNFNDVLHALISLLSLFTLDGWADFMWRCIDALPPDDAVGSVLVPIIFIVHVFFGSLVVSSLYQATTVQTYAGLDHSHMLTEGQVRSPTIARARSTRSPTLSYALSRSPLLS